MQRSVSTLNVATVLSSLLHRAEMQLILQMFDLLTALKVTLVFCKSGYCLNIVANVVST